MSNSSSIYPERGVAKRTVLGSLMNTIGYAVTVLQQIVFVPLFLWAWGQALYGEWLILFSFLAYFSISHFGMGTYVRNTLTQSYAKGDHKNYARVFKSAMGIFGAISAVFFVGLLFFSLFLPFTEWFNIGVARESSVRFAVLLLGVYMLLGVVGGLVTGLYTTIGQYPRQGALRNFREVCLVFFVAVALVLGGGFVSVAFVYLGILAGFTLFSAFDAFRRYPELKDNFRDARIDWRLAKSFLGQGFVFLLIPFSRIMYVQGSVLLIGAMLGAVHVAIFAVHRTLAHMVKRFVGIITPAILPELTAGEVRGEYGKMRKIHSIFMKLVLFASMTATVFLLFGGGDILRLWTSGEIPLDTTLWLSLLTLIPITILWESNAVFQVAVNKYHMYAVSRIASVILGFVLAFFLIQSMGLAGVVVGFLIGEAVFNLWTVPLKTLKIIHATKRGFILLIFWGVPLFALQFFASWVLSVTIENPWLMIGEIGITVTILGVTYTYFLWLTEEERRLIRTIFTKSLRYARARARSI
jgi:O-antigen/teichoic acid export membrane protein